MAAASPAAASRPAALIPISAGPARIQGWERSARTGAGGAVGVSPQPTARISAASPALVERLPTGSTRGLRRELTPRQRDGGLVDDRVVGDDGEVEMHELTFWTAARLLASAPIPASARRPSRAARSRW